LETKSTVFVALYLALNVWCSFAMAELWPGTGKFPPLFVILSFVATALVFCLGYYLYFILANVIGRRMQPREVAEPPVAAATAKLPFSVAPKPTYPVFACARRQEGWVHVELRIGTDGKVSAYRILSQAPGRTFEQSVVLSLQHTRFAAAVDGSFRTSEAVVRFRIGSPDIDAEAVPGPDALK